MIMSIIFTICTQQINYLLSIKILNLSFLNVFVSSKVVVGISGYIIFQPIKLQI